ncbi:DUF2892 domain-containing protein [Thiomicrorhabdus sp. ZW0627]|uniref:YgaP family membrane protein n=1 Tax=Thiomicrorhabdus sp. ZW0627 TaxID=3039774 RepID=UPI002436C9DC|nr:DUF2892 domain-containing protein [Thiomicrorhabdus sp. ZW0627]MDG6773684.1 DUF2892 domain-containing protein [Thiomicrorhabdus sp. ZW0627]
MNVGRLDQMIRIIVGALLIIASLAGLIGAWGYIGIIPLLTGFFRWCPLYKLLGIQTCPLHESAKR